jgi:peptidyl-dipeptidase Dcp
MWSEVMDADAFDAFEEKGNPFDPDVAASLEANILSCGGAQPPEELYTAFRGRMPDIAPLLKGRGLA